MIHHTELSGDGKISAREHSFKRFSTDSKLRHFSYVYIQVKKLIVSWSCFLLTSKIMCRNFIWLGFLSHVKVLFSFTKTLDLFEMQNKAGALVWGLQNP